MFEIKPRERQLHGGTPQPCNPLGRAGVSLPPLRASPSRADPQPPQESFASGGSGSIRGGSKEHVSVGPDAILHRGRTIPSSARAPAAERLRVQPAPAQARSRGDRPSRRGEDVQRGGARGICGGFAPAARLLLQSASHGNKSRRSATRKSLSRGAPQPRLSGQPRFEK